MYGVEAQRVIDDELLYHEKRVSELCARHAESLESQNENLAEVLAASTCTCGILNWYRVAQVCGHWGRTTLESAGLLTPSPISDELADHERRVFRLRTLRNTYAPISKLPTEILSMIFQALRGRSFGNVRRWHYVAHVCGQWRSAALGAAFLWAEPPTHLHDYTVAMLQRSRSYPLNVKLSRRTERKTIDAIFIHEFSRIKYLNVDGMRAYEAPTRMSAALQLTHLEIDGFSRRAIGEGLFHPLIIPKIRHIQLKHMDLTWGVLRSTTLTSLSLIGMRLLGNASWNTFFDGLRQVPMLESLELSPLELSFENTGENQNIETLELSHLRQLKLKSTTAIIRTILSYISFPRLRRARIECEDDESNTDDYSRLLPAIFHLYTKGDFDSIITQLDIERAAFSLGPYFRFVAGDDLTEEFYSALMQALARMPECPLLTIVGLQLTDVRNLSSGREFARLFSGLTEVKKIEFRKCACQGIRGLGAVEDIDDDDEVMRGDPVPFPNLEHISCFDSCSYCRWEDDVVNDFTTDLKKCLKARERRGLPRIREFVRNWYLDPAGSDTEELAKMVDTMTFVRYIPDDRWNKGW